MTYSSKNQIDKLIKISTLHVSLRVKIIGLMKNKSCYTSEFGIVFLGIVKIGVAKIGLAKIGNAKIGIVKIGIAKIGILKIRINILNNSLN